MHLHLKGKMADFKKVVWVIFLVVAALRIYMAFSSPYFEFDSYFHIRQIESIAKTGLPVYNDPLSAGQEFFIFSPLFHYIMALFSFAVPITIIGKIIPNILYALLIPLSYYVTRQITENKKLSIIAPIVVAFMPVLWSNIFALDPLCMAIPAIFFSFYFLVGEGGKKSIMYFLALITFASFLSPIAIVAVPVIWLYILFLKVEKIKEKGPLTELAIFLTFFILLIQFILYKNAILVNGLSVIWQNMPVNVFNVYFAKTGILDVIANIGILPFIFGLYEIYIFSFEKKERASSLFISTAIVLGVFLWAKFIPIHVGMILLGMAITVVSISSIEHFVEYFKKIKFRNSGYVTIATIIIFLVSATVPAFYYMNLSKNDLPSKEDFDGLLWLKENSSEGSTILGGVKDGYAISAVSQRKKVIDSNFLAENDAEERFNDVATVYTTNYETKALEVLNKYNAKYIFFGKNVKNEFNATGLGFEDKNCFSKLFEEGKTRIYKTWCDLE